MTVGTVEAAAIAAQALYTYAYGVDEQDEAVLAELADDDVALTRVDGTRHGRERFLDLYRETWASAIYSRRHLVTNIRARVQDDGTIHADAYFTAITFDPERSQIITGTYADTIRVIDGRSRLLHKRIAVDGVLVLPAAERSWAGHELPR
jgi:hypothetical protein